jgi:hypothetical protein
MTGRMDGKDDWTDRHLKYYIYRLCHIRAIVGFRVFFRGM